MSKERIYIVEDERIIVIDLQRRLERLGYLVCGSAASGEEALAGIRQNRPDLVLMDIVILGNMDGIDVALELKKEMDIPVIFLSAYTDSRTLDRAKAVSPLGYILKPFKERELATMLEMALFKSIADTRIREKEQLFAAILNSTTDAILVIGSNSQIVFLNPEAELILEITDAEAKTRSPGELFTLSEMESGDNFEMPNFPGQANVLKAHNLRLTNWKQNSFVVEMNINQELSDIETELRYIISFKDISRLHEVTDSLKYQTSHDTLTGLLNRNELALKMKLTLARIGRQPEKASALFIDIDHFKVINDSCGTQAGDVLLKETAGRIRQLLTGQDYAARIGGDDFVLVHYENPEAPSALDAVNLAQSLLQETRANPFRWDEREYPIAISVGIVPLDTSFKNEHEVMIAGNETVLITHESGGNRYTSFRQDENRTMGTISISDWISKIHGALLHNGFRLYYQPIVPLAADNPHEKIEILLRLREPDGTILMPGDFIPIAERYNIMNAVDRWVVKNSLGAFARLRTAGHPLAETIFCINLSGSSLADDSMIGYIVDTAAELSVPPDHVCLELTETNAILNLTAASRFIHILKEKGFTFALDDFGSGFSSFNYLKNLPVDYLKIDGCFIRNMDKDEVDCTMVQAITSMCRVLGLRTIGEFAENDAIIGKLRDIGVDYAQGYGISMPKPLDSE